MAFTVFAANKIAGKALRSVSRLVVIHYRDPKAFQSISRTLYYRFDQSE